MIKSLQSCPFSRLNKTSSLSLSSQDECSSPAPRPPWLLSFGLAPVDQHLSCTKVLKTGCSFLYGDSQVQRKGRMLITSLDIMAMLLSVQPRVLFAARAHCWLMASSLSIKNPGPIWPDGPQPVLLQGSLPSQVQGFEFVLVKFHNAPVDHSSSLSEFLWTAPCPKYIDWSPSACCHLCKCDKGALSCLLQVIDKGVISSCPGANTYHMTEEGWKRKIYFSSKSIQNIIC